MNSMMKVFRNFLLMALCLVMVAGCGFDFGFGGDKGTEKNKFARSGDKGGSWGKPEKARFKIPVTVDHLKRDRMYAYLQAVGTVVPIKEIELKPEMTARIYFTKKWMEGDQVKKGDTLAAMDDRNLKMTVNEAQLQLEMAQSSVRPASAALAQAIKDEQFNKVMLDRGAISKSTFDQYSLARIQRENSYQSALQQIESRKMSLQRYKQELEKIAIIIPYDGVLLPANQSVVNSQKSSGESDLTLMNGQMLGQGAVICRLANIDQVYVALDVPAKDLEEIEIGQKVELDIYSRTSKIYEGTVAEVSTALNASTRTYTVNILVENLENELRPGMFAKARIITDEKLHAIRIPRELVLLRNGYSVVFVAKEKEIEPEEELPKLGPEGKETDSIAKGGDEEKDPAVAKPTEDQTNGGPPAAYADEILDATDEEPEEPEIQYEAEQRTVSTGIENRDDVEILSGLKEGDLLIVLGYETLTNGVDVNVTVRQESDPLPVASSN